MAVVVAVSLALATRGSPSAGLSGQATTSAAPTASPSQSALTPFVARLDNGTAVPIDGVGACDAIGEAWLTTWCMDLVAFNPATFPQTLEEVPNDWYGPTFQQRMDAAFGWAALHHDQTFCSNAFVSRYVAVGMQVTDGRTACEDGLERAWKAGTFFVTSPSTSESVTVTLLPQATVAPIP